MNSFYAFLLVVVVVVMILFDSSIFPIGEYVSTDALPASLAAVSAECGLPFELCVGCGHVVWFSLWFVVSFGVFSEFDCVGDVSPSLHQCVYLSASQASLGFLGHYDEWARLPSG